MKPDVDLTLQLLSATLLAELAPLVPVEYAQKNLAIAAMALQMSAEEWDRAAARRVEENQELRRIFGEAAPVVKDPTLAGHLTVAAETRDSSLLIRDLDRENDELRHLLIELHAHLEELETPDAQRLEDVIWQELRISTERRALALAPF